MVFIRSPANEIIKMNEVYNKDNVQFFESSLGIMRVYKDIKTRQTVFLRRKEKYYKFKRQEFIIKHSKWTKEEINKETYDLNLKIWINIINGLNNE